MCNNVILFYFRVRVSQDCVLLYEGESLSNTLEYFNSVFMYHPQNGTQKMFHKEYLLFLSNIPCMVSVSE